jgi:hypothetical protein
MDMFLKNSPWTSIIVVACTSLLDMFLKLWIQNFNVFETYFGPLVFYVFLKFSTLDLALLILDHVLFWCWSWWWPYISYLIIRRQQPYYLTPSCLLFNLLLNPSCASKIGTHVLTWIYLQACLKVLVKFITNLFYNY